MFLFQIIENKRQLRQFYRQPNPQIMVMSESKNDEDADGGETEVYNFKLKIDRWICHQQYLTSSFCNISDEDKATTAEL